VVARSSQPAQNQRLAEGRLQPVGDRASEPGERGGRQPRGQRARAKGDGRIGGIGLGALGW